MKNDSLQIKNQTRNNTLVYHDLVYSNYQTMKSSERTNERTHVGATVYPSGIVTFTT